MGGHRIQGSAGPRRIAALSGHPPAIGGTIPRCPYARPRVDSGSPYLGTAKRRGGILRPLRPWFANQVSPPRPSTDPARGVARATPSPGDSQRTGGRGEGTDAAARPRRDLRCHAVIFQKKLFTTRPPPVLQYCYPPLRIHMAFFSLPTDSQLQLTHGQTCNPNRVGEGRLLDQVLCEAEPV